MKKKTRNLILSIVFTLVLLLTFTITYAIFAYQETGTSNNQLVMGDIYMHYNETNQLKIENAMPQEGFKTLLTGYKVNPIMAEQDASDTTTELYACINLFQNDWGWGLDEGEDFESFCQGTGTSWGWTLQMLLDDMFTDEDGYNELLSLNIIQEETLEYTSIKMNPEIATQTAEYENELTACVSFVSSWETLLDEGTTLETFCQGTGTYDGGVYFQEDIDYWVDNNSIYYEYLSSNNIIIEDGDSYIINPGMATQEVGEINELMTCIGLVTSEGYEFDDGTTAESFCKGEGTARGGITLKGEFEEEKDYVDYMTYIGNDLLENNIILTERNLPYFEFTISGKNTYTKKDIYYDVLLSHGNTLENKIEENRIKDNFLRFSLYEILDDNTEKNIFLNKSYSSLENKSIHVETIPKNTMNEINKTYRLYMWIDNDVVIGNVGEDYTPEEWKNVFASIKVNVSGDFDEKDLRENFINHIKAKYGNDASLVAVNTDGDLYDGTGEIREYRYSGEIANNYVFFDTNEDGEKSDNEIWRIIGIFYDNGEEKIKLVRNRMLTQTEIPKNYEINGIKYLIAYDNTISDGVFGNNIQSGSLNGNNSNNWSIAGLQYYLNTKNDESDNINIGYLSFFTDKTTDLISSATYYLGNVDDEVSTVKLAYVQERDETRLWSGNQFRWNGLVGLMYPSDYGYSVNSEYWETDMFGWDAAESDGVTASSTSWIYQSTNHNKVEWLLSPSSAGSNYVINYNSSGNISYTLAKDCYYGIKGARPTIYLKSSVDIVDGDGTEEAPYVVVIE